MPTLPRRPACLIAAAFVAAGALFAPPARADHAEVLPGHSVHGDTFDEGPRRGAYVMGRTGRVSFPVTTKSKQVQAFIDQGVGQLHGFWYLEAERSFRQAAALDPDCPMAYWGMAMANLTNAKRAKGFVEQAAKRKYAADLSDKERDWLDALAAYYADAPKGGDRKRTFVKAIKQMVDRDPKDVEAKAFYARYAWEYKTTGDGPLDANVIDKVLSDLFALAPDHPAHHFRIHLWDEKGQPTNALTAAAMCGPAAPGVAHMWHMPGHTYSKLTRYADAAWQQEASTRVDHAYMIRDRVMPYEIHNYAHNNEWLCRDLLNVGRVGDAVDLAKNMVELPRHPKYNAASNRGSGAEYGRARLLDALSMHELWQEYLDLTARGYLADEPDADQQVRRLRFLGVAQAAVGNAAEAERQIAALEKLKAAAAKPATQPATAPSTRPVAVADATTKPSTRPAAVARGGGGNRPGGGRGLPASANNASATADKAIAHVRAQLAMNKGDWSAAVDLLAKAEARKEHQSQALLKAGNRDKAVDLAKRAVDEGKGQTYPLANQVAVLHAVGKKDEARAAFDKLREISEAVDLSVPAYAKLEPIAVEFGFGRDWRVLRTPPKDLGVRPDLQTLGPFRWSPSPAPAWEAKGPNGETVSSAQYRGRPTIVVFYLGHSCLHCTQQLHAFIPMAKEFEQAGISLVGVSTDTQENLHKAWEGAKLEAAGAFPFPLAADPDGRAFKAFGVRDDFEDRPLHGTFLIDASGKVRWRDISHEPFMDTKFLLGEAKRLLAQDGGDVARDAASVRTRVSDGR